MTFLENLQQTIDQVTRETLELIMEFNANSEEMKKLIERNNEISYLISKNEASVIELNEYVKRFSTEIQVAGSFEFEGDEDE